MVGPVWLVGLVWLISRVVPVGLVRRRWFIWLIRLVGLMWLIGHIWLVGIIRHIGLTWPTRPKQSLAQKQNQSNMNGFLIQFGRTEGTPNRLGAVALVPGPLGPIRCTWLP